MVLSVPGIDQEGRYSGNTRDGREANYYQTIADTWIDFCTKGLVTKVRLMVKLGFHVPFNI